MSAVRFVLNGRPWSEEGAPPTMTVLDWLRTRAHLTGTKEGCAEGDCGACTIVLGRLVDGAVQYQAVNSCLMMLPQLDGCAVFTVEGLAAPAGAVRVSRGWRAMVEAVAPGWGLCAPDFAMAMFARPHPGGRGDAAPLHDALAGTLCRCPGYRSIVEASRRLAGGPTDRFTAQTA